MGDIAKELMEQLEVKYVFHFTVAGHKFGITESVVVTWIIMAVMIVARFT